MFAVVCSWSADGGPVEFGSVGDGGGDAVWQVGDPWPPEWLPQVAEVQGLGRVRRSLPTARDRDHCRDGNNVSICVTVIGLID